MIIRDCQDRKEEEVDQDLQDQWVLWANLVEEDNVGLLVNWENLEHQVDQVPKDQEERMDQR